MSEHSMETPAADQRQNIVKIKINNSLFDIHRGRRSVSEIKNTGGVLLADVLNQIVNGKLEPLADDAFVTIKGGEEFVSHPRDSASS